MATLRFSDYRASNYEFPLTLEEVFRLYTAFSNLHDTSFDSIVDITSVTVTDVSSGGFTGVGGYSVASTSFEVQYHKADHDQWVMITSSEGYGSVEVGTDDTGRPVVRRNNVIVQLLPLTTPEEANVRLVFRQLQTLDNENQIWATVALYMNEALITTWQQLLNTAFSNFRVQFNARNSETRTYTNIRIPELTEIAEFGTLDPGANPMNGLQQTIEGRYLKFFVRFDGTFRAWRVKAVTNKHTFDPGEFFITSLGNDLTDFATHVRMMGAYIWSEAIDEAGAAKWGHRFQELNNSMLLTKFECFREASNTLKRMQENAFTESAEVPYVIFLEPEDRVATDGDWLVTAYSLSLAVAELSQQLDLRFYAWGEV